MRMLPSMACCLSLLVLAGCDRPTPAANATGAPARPGPTTPQAPQEAQRDGSGGGSTTASPS